MTFHPSTNCEHLRKAFKKSRSDPTSSAVRFGSESRTSGRTQCCSDQRGHRGESENWILHAAYQRGLDSVEVLSAEVAPAAIVASDFYPRSVPVN
jgi:hypothetical protein